MDLDGLARRTSSFTGGNGGSCVEVAGLPERVAVRDTKDRSRAPHVPADVEWRRAPGADPADAVEVARLPCGGAALRPAGDPTAEPHVCTAAEWEAFVAGVRNDEFDGPW